MGILSVKKNGKMEETVFLHMKNTQQIMNSFKKM